SPTTSDLDIPNGVTVAGAGRAATIIDGNLQHRIFQIEASRTGHVRDLSLRNGQSSEGGCLANAGTGTVTRGRLTGCSGSQGGGIANQGVLELIDSSVDTNGSGPTDGSGGLNG